MDPVKDDMTTERLRTLTAHALHGVLGWLVSSARLSAEERRAFAALELYLRTAPQPDLERFLSLYRDQP